VREQEVKPGEIRYRALERERDLALSQVEREDPQLFAAVMKYLEEMRGPLEERGNRIKAEKAAESLTHSLAGRVGKGLEPIIKPMGFDWKIGIALVGALAAREVFVAQLGIVYSIGAEDEPEALRARLQADYSTLTAICILLFCAVSMMCMATFAITRSETNSWKWACVQWVGLTVFAYILTMTVYQIGSLVGLA